MAISNYQRFFAMFKKLQQAGMKMERDEYLYEQTGKSSLKQLSDWEYNEVCRVMQDKLRQNTFSPQEKEKNLKRKRLISNFYELGYDNAVEALKLWVKKQKFKKELNDHDTQELSVLIAISDKMVKQHHQIIRETPVE